MSQRTCAFIFCQNPLFTSHVNISFIYYDLTPCSYINGFLYQLKRFVDNHGPEGIAELNSVATAHTITLEMLDTKAWSYCGVDITPEGVFRLTFKSTMLGTNIDDTAAEMAKALSKAPQPTSAPKLSYAVRHGIKTEYAPQIEELREKAAAELQNPDIKFEPDFEALVDTLKTKKWDHYDAERWEGTLGNRVLLYYQAFVDVLVREKFSSDEMLREGFAEGVEKGVVKLRVIPKLPSGYNRLLVEDGELIMETDLEHWAVNIDQVATKLVDLL